MCGTRVFNFVIAAERLEHNLFSKFCFGSARYDGLGDDVEVDSFGHGSGRVLSGRAGDEREFGGFGTSTNYSADVCVHTSCAVNLDFAVECQRISG